MKKFISILLVCSMILLGTATVFATETEAEGYDLAELFANYEEKSLSEMTEFVNSNPQAHRFIEFFYECSRDDFTPIFLIHRSGDNISRIPNVLEVGFTDRSPKYLTSGSRVTTINNADYDVLMGDVGNKFMSIEFEKDFIEYVNSLDRVERNKTILNFLMNMADNDEIAGISWAFSYWIGANMTDSTYKESIIGDCNGDGSVNAIDSYLLKKAVVGYENEIDPFAVDINADGAVNAMDSFALKIKIVNG